MAETEGEQPHGATPPQGQPSFTAPDAPAPGQYAPPTFVTSDGTPVGGPGAPPHHAPGGPGAPVFVNADGTPAGYHPPQPAPATPPQPFGTFGQSPAAPQAPAAPAPAGYAVAGGQPGGPIFVVPEHEQAQSALDAEDRPWRWWVGPVAVTIAFVAVLFLGVFLAIAVGAGGGDVESAFDDNTHWLGLAQDILWVGVALLVPFMAVRYLKPEQLGLQKRPLGRSVGVLFAVMIAFYVLAAIYAAALGLDQDSNELLNDTGIGESISRDVLYALLFTVAAPVAEELLFRGLLFRSLRDAFITKFGTRGGVLLGAVISGVIFGGIHVGGGQNDFLPVLMALGVLLALAYQWSGTLYVPVVIHSINNALATGANSEPAADWIYALIALGPVISIGVLLLLTKFIRATFPQERPDPPAPPVPPVPPAQGSPFFTTPSGPPGSL